MRARVKWFNDAKGFGFLKLDDGREAFVHYSAIQADGFRTLVDGEEVEFALMEGPKGLLAANVMRLGGKKGRAPAPASAPRGG